MVKKILLGVAALVVIVVVAVGSYAGIQISRFNASMDKVYDVPLPTVTRSTDAAVLARGKHLTNSIGACSGRLCHGSDLGGGPTTEMGPVMTFTPPDITSASLGAAYSDGELARLIRYGVKKDGHSVAFMPVEDFRWLPDSDVLAIVSYLRTVPPVDRPNGPTVIKPLGKILDRKGAMVLDVARKISAMPLDLAPSPTPTAAYGAYVSRMCQGCHGETFSGGPLPGAPPSIPTPLNLTPDATGLKGWSFEDFDRLMRQGVRKNGQQLNPFMPIEAWSQFDDVEMHALWAYLQTVPPAPFGNR
jgi:mono/diheme cytochrome c family protein